MIRVRLTAKPDQPPKFYHRDKVKLLRRPEKKRADKNEDSSEDLKKLED